MTHQQKQQIASFNRMLAKLWKEPLYLSPEMLAELASIHNDIGFLLEKPKRFPAALPATVGKF